MPLVIMLRHSQEAMSKINNRVSRMSDDGSECQQQPSSGTSPVGMLLMQQRVPLIVGQRLRHAPGTRSLAD